MEHGRCACIICTCARCRCVLILVIASVVSARRERMGNGHTAWMRTDTERERERDVEKRSSSLAGWQWQLLRYILHGIIITNYDHDCTTIWRYVGSCSIWPIPRNMSRTHRVVRLAGIVYPMRGRHTSASSATRHKQQSYAAIISRTIFHAIQNAIRNSERVNLSALNPQHVFKFKNKQIHSKTIRPLSVSSRLSSRAGLISTIEFSFSGGARARPYSPRSQ